MNLKETIKQFFVKLPLGVHIYYTLMSVTICYVYYHKFVARADFYDKLSSGGIFAILSFDSATPVQYRILTPFFYKALQTIFFFVSYKPVYLILITVTVYLIIISWYYVLNVYFSDKQTNSWIAPIILYPAAWNLIILNGQFFNYDFSLLLIMILGFFFILKRQNLYLLLTILIGTFNHDSVIFLIFTYALFNIKNLFKAKTLFYTLLYLAVYLVLIFMLQELFKNNRSDYMDTVGAEHFFYNSFNRNLSLLIEFKFHIIVRDIVFNFGGMLLISFLLFFRLRIPLLKSRYFYVLLIIIPYIFVVFYRAGIEEMRNYNAIIPFVTILFLSIFSNLKGSFLSLSKYVRFKS